MSYTGDFCWTKENANMVVNNDACKREGIYWTAIKGEPSNPAVPEECWAVTNRFDPKVSEEDENTSA